MKKLISLTLLLLFLLSPVYADALAEEAEESTLPAPGICVDEEGFCVSVGEFFDMLETLLTEDASPFFPGSTVSITRGNASPEIRIVSVPPSDKLVLSASEAGRDAFPSDEESFTLLVAMGPMDSDTNFLGMTVTATSMLYLCYPEVTDFSEALHLLSTLIENAGIWVQDGAMEYQFAALGDGNVIFAIREIAPYAEG